MAINKWKYLSTIEIKYKILNEIDKKESCREVETWYNVGSKTISNI